VAGPRRYCDLPQLRLGALRTALGAFYRRLSACVGKAKAVTATARKIAVLFYNTLGHGIEYSDPGASHLRGELPSTRPHQSRAKSKVVRLYPKARTNIRLNVS
jgi:hypothetical protein